MLKKHLDYYRKIIISVENSCTASYFDTSLLQPWYLIIIIIRNKNVYMKYIFSDITHILYCYFWSTECILAEIIIIMIIKNHTDPHML